jgi:hypothetical protein
MLIVWQGRGWVVALSIGVCLLASDYFTGLYYHDSEYYADHGWPKLAAFWVAAGITYLFVPKQAEPIAQPSLVDDTQPVVLRRDTFFMVHMRYWPAILLGLGILFYFLP